MISHILHVFERNLIYARRLTGDITDDAMALQPAPGMNHPAWILGHLAWTCDLTGGLAGVEPCLPSEWTALFDNQSEPTADRSVYPHKETLMAALEAGHAAVAGAVRGLPAEAWAKPLPFEEFRAAMPTVGDALVYLLTSHEMGHLGQLSAWRRVQGMSRI